VFWLISNILLYLTGFFKRRNQAKTRKNSQKCTCGTHRFIAFTIPALTKVSAYAKLTIHSAITCAVIPIVCLGSIAVSFKLSISCPQHLPLWTWRIFDSPRRAARGQRRRLEIREDCPLSKAGIQNGADPARLPDGCQMRQSEAPAIRKACRA
jgi:hypothetical protein